MLFEAELQEGQWYPTREGRGERRRPFEWLPALEGAASVLFLWEEGVLSWFDIELAYPGRPELVSTIFCICTSSTCTNGAHQNRRNSSGTGCRMRP